MNIKYLVVLLIILGVGISFMTRHHQSELPLVAIASYGPHPTLSDTITGIKRELAKQGFDAHHVRYDIEDVGFDSSLIPQMISHFQSEHPQVMVVLTTPVAQLAKATVHDIPLVYAAITDPKAVGLLKHTDQPAANMTGSSDHQNLSLMLQFAKTLMPKATRVGLLYATGESNDLALVEMMQKAVSAASMRLKIVPITQARDVPSSMQQFKNQVDFIYVGTSGPIQPTLPVIASLAKQMNIPVLNAGSQAVKDGLVLASYGVDYIQVGKNTGKLVSALLRGTPIAKLAPVDPGIEDHHGFVNQKELKEFGLVLPPNHHQLTLVG